MHHQHVQVRVVQGGILLVLHAICGLGGLMWGQDVPASASRQPREAWAQRLNAPIELDGALGDAGWSDVPVHESFTQYAPVPGAAPSQQTSVKFAYDDNALYIGARMWDRSPDSILHQLSERDRTENTDEFGIWFSPFNDGLNAVRFVTTPDGIQIDEQLSPNADDPSWDAVWDVVCRMDSSGWVAEFRIPWMAFRFPEKPDQLWGMNMFRSIRRLREESVWNPMDPTQKLLNQGGILRGIQGIDPPLRLSLFPYISSYRTWVDGQTGASQNGGMDMKIGIGNAFTLDMTLVPDFGQVVTDNLVLNLSPFEIRFNENRQFFQEGTELFTKSGIFYSRRIGEEGRLLNASKISGRLANGLGLGLLQAVATAESDTSLVSYTVAVADQNLPNNGYVTTTASLVAREGSRYDAWVQSSNFEVRNAANTWAVTGGATLNQKFGADAANADEGHTWNVALNKMAGNFTFNLGHFLESATYDPNDLGYLQAPNEVVTYINANYGMFEPRGRWNRINWSFDAFYNQIEAPRLFNNWFLSSSCRATTRGFNTWNLELNTQPVDGNNYFASRIEGQIWREPSWYSANAWFSSDYRNRFALDLGYFFGGGGTYRDWIEQTYRVAPRFRVNDHVMLTYVWKIIDRANERGWAFLDTAPDGRLISVFGNRHNTELTQVLNASYIFTNRMSLTARVRHAWSQVDYHAFHALAESGSLNAETYSTALPTDDYNVNYNAWSVDMVYRWIFAPGSEVNIVWKNQLFDQVEAGSVAGYSLPESYGQNFAEMLESGFSNSLSIRIVSFIDYSRFQQGLRGFER